MSNTTRLIPSYSIVPHGVASSSDGVVHAVFKMVASVRQFEKLPDANDAFPITEDQWKDFVKAVNDAKWQYKVSVNELKFQIVSELNGSDVAIPVLFERKGPQRRQENAPAMAKTAEGNLTSDERNDSFGYGFDIGGRADNMEFVTDRQHTFTIPAYRDPVRPKQFGKEINPVGRNIESIRKNYETVLHNAGQFPHSPGAIRKSSPANTFDFKVLYANIMAEPYLAEHHFGLIREIRIKADDLLKHSNKFSYSIKLENLPVLKPGDPSQTHELGGFLLKKQGAKYYNGLEKLFFVKNEFLDIRANFSDLYKGVLDEKKPHPDGIYINVSYKKPPGTSAEDDIHDPFAEPGIKGYNAVINNGEFYSLSFHQKEYRSKKNGELLYSYKTSGVLNARTEIITSPTESYRNNVLLAWRGDNLMVNRKIEVTQTNDKTEIITKLKDDHSCENSFIHDNLFVRSEELVPGSQVQLLAGASYYFFLRVVGYTGHYLPSRKEVSPEEYRYTLTLEDELVMDDFNRFAITGRAEVFDVAGVKNLPIKAVNIIGEKQFDDRNSGFVDTSNHMVLNRITGESSEKRFIYPSAIKLEDGKFLQYLAPAKLKKRVTERLSLEEFVHRCIRMEKRSGCELPKLARQRHKINHLADMRGRQLVFYPADLFTFSKVAQLELPDVFSYTDVYPYYRQARSAKIMARLDSSISGGKAGLNRYSILLNNQPIYTSLTEGVYQFKVYVTDNHFKNENIGDYNATTLTISIVDKPLQPVSETGVITVQRTATDRDRKLFSAPFSLAESDTWRSIKYTEETTVLQLSQRDPEKLYQAGLRKGGENYELMTGEFPYETFLITEGDIEQRSELRTSVYPSVINLTLKSKPVSAGAGSEPVFMSLRLNEKERLHAKQSTGGLKLFLHDDTPIGEAAAFDLNIAFNQSTNKFELRNGTTGNILAIIDQPINPDISLRDIDVPESVLRSLQHQPPDFEISLKKKGEYIFSTDLKHPYAARKRVRLFASSAFQAYFPKAESEFELGTIGSIHSLLIPNNIQPEMPELDADILLMYRKDEHWNNRESRKIKETTTQSLIRLTLSQDFMKEGKNKLGIILRRLKPKVEGKAESVFGEDITKLSNNDFSSTGLKEILVTENSRYAFLEKYLDPKDLFVNYKIGDNDYEVMQCLPFYNTKINKWQVILEVQHFRNTETMFFRLSTIKIAEGHGASVRDTGSYSVVEDNTGTKLSPVSRPVTFPLYNSRKIQLSRSTDSFSISYEGTEVNKGKLFFVMLTKRSYKYHLAEDGSKGFPELEIFGCSDAVSEEKNGSILMFSGEKISIERKSCKAILVLEFEVHSDCDFDITCQPSFVNFNPLFDKRGIRLINVTEFKA